LSLALDTVPPWHRRSRLKTRKRLFLPHASCLSLTYLSAMQAMEILLAQKS